MSGSCKLSGPHWTSLPITTRRRCTLSSVVRAVVVKWLIESGNLPKDYNPGQRTKYAARAGRDTVLDITKLASFRVDTSTVNS